MTKAEAIAAMVDGKKVAHHYFTPDEWMERVDGIYEFEDGCLCEPEDFWSIRDGAEWLDGWYIVD